MITYLRKFLFTNTSNKQIAIKNTFWIFVGEFGVRALKLGLFVYAARTLGASEWGTFSYALALMSLIAVIADIGVSTVLLKEVTRNKENYSFIATGFFLKVGLSFFASIALLACMLFIDRQNGARMLLPIMALFLFLDSMRDFGFTLNRAFEKMEVEAFGKIVSTTALVLFSIFFIHSYPTALSLTWAYVAGGIVGMGIMYVSVKPYISKLLPHFSKALISPLLKESWPLALISVFGIFLSNTDTVILGRFEGAANIGLYAAAQRPIQLLYSLPALFGMALLPIFSRLTAQETLSPFKIVVKKSIFYSLSGTILIVGIGVLFGNQIITALFGNEYYGAGIVFRYMITALIIATPGAIISNALFALGKQKITAQAIGIGVVSNIAICFSIIPRYGITGAAIGAVLSQVLTNGILLIEGWKLLRNKK